MRESLKSLISSMPSGSGDMRVNGDHVRIFTKSATDYVWPDLLRDRESGQTPSPIILVTAPGAMGKSAAAKAIAAATRMPYIDLAQVRVGSGSLTGELAKALGFGAMGQFVEDLKAGEAALILDSSDEAQLTSGRDNYLAFLTDLAWLLLDAKPRNQVVMLGRRDATETTVLALMDLGLNPPLYQVAPLSHSQASGLIALTLDQKKLSEESYYTVHRQHHGPFAALRDAVFEDLAFALDPTNDVAGYWDRCADFLGYPPVVVALAERLAVDNPGAALEDLRAVPRVEQPVQRGVLLRSVLEKIMDRESRKVRERVGEALSIRASSPERRALYGPDEQAARLLELTGTVGVSVEQPAVLEEHERARYEDLIQSFLLDHPFVMAKQFANVIFSDYIRAWSISSSISGLYAVARAEFFASLPKPGPFFAHFLHAMSAGPDGLGAVPEDVVNDLHHSYNLGTESGHAIYVHREDDAFLVLHDGGPTLEGLPLGLTYKVQEVSGVLVLTSPLARFLCVTDYEVLLRGTGGNLDIGPNVSIVADGLVIEASALTAISDGRGGQGSLNLFSAGRAEHVGELKVAALPPNALAVSWPAAWHQWKPYLKDLTFGRRIESRVASQVLLGLWRVFTSFKSSVKKDPSVSADKMDRVIVGENPIFNATLKCLIAIGLVVREGNLYRIDLDSLSSYGVSWTNLHGDNPVDSLKGVLEAVVSRDEFAPFLSR